MTERRVPGECPQSVMEPLPNHCWAEGGDQKDEKGLPLYLASQVSLRNRLEALDLEGEVEEDVMEGPPMRSHQKRQSTPHLNDSTDCGLSATPLSFVSSIYTYIYIYIHKITKTLRLELSF